MRVVLRCCLFAAGSLLLTLLTNGCALRATTDFGPGDEPHRQSVGSGVGPFPNLLNTDGHHDNADDAAVPRSGDDEALSDGGR